MQILFSEQKSGTKYECLKTHFAFKIKKTYQIDEKRLLHLFDYITLFIEQIMYSKKMNQTLNVIKIVVFQPIRNEYNI